MLVYIESNFVLELAFRQEQAESCRAILSLCADRRARLIMPAFSVAEPFETFVRRAKDRKLVREKLDSQIGQLARNKTLAAQVETLRPLMGLLVQSEQVERAGLRESMQEILASAELIPLDASVIEDAIVLEDSLQLSPQDAIVMASVLRHLEANGTEASCFLNRNTKDFDNPDVVERLRNLDCKLLPRFDDGLGYLRSATAL